MHINHSLTCSGLLAPIHFKTVRSLTHSLSLSQFPPSAPPQHCYVLNVKQFVIYIVTTFNSIKFSFLQNSNSVVISVILHVRFNDI